MIMLKKNKMFRMFSLVELMVSMFIFLLMMGVMMRYFTAANQIWRSTAKKNEIYSNARIAMDLMARDLQGMMYNNDRETPKGIYPFWHTTAGLPVGPVSDPIHGNLGECISFISYSPISPLKILGVSAISNICEVRYSVVAQGDNEPVSLGSTDTIPEFWLIRSTVGDNDNSTPNKYNFDEFPRAQLNGTTLACEMQDYSGNRMRNIFVRTSTASESSCGDWQKVIPHVVELEFKCYGYDNDSLSSTYGKLIEIPSQDGTETNIALTYYIKDRGSYYPDRIKIIMSIIDKTTYYKYVKVYNSDGQTAADKVIDDNKITFSRTVYLGNRESF
jgi:hypothetical protein